MTPDTVAPARRTAPGSGHSHSHDPSGQPHPPAAGRSRALRRIILGLAILGALLALRSVTGGGAWSLPDQGQDFITLAISVVIESLPFVILGIVLSIVVQVWLPAGAIVRVLPSNPFLRRIVISFIGMLLPVCECGNVPLARGLILRGFTVPESITFLLAAPILNPITIVTTYQAFGWDNGILLARIIGGFVIANLIGWVFSRHANPAALLTSRFAAQCRLPEQSNTNGGRWSRSVDMFVRETSGMMPALVVGSALAGLIQVAVSREVLVSLGSNPLLSILAMMVLAFVISICSNVDAFFALSLGSTFMPGAIVAFLVFGPVLDIKMVALMRTTYATRTIVQIAAITALVTLALGLVVNYVA